MAVQKLAFDHFVEKLDNYPHNCLPLVFVSYNILNFLILKPFYSSTQLFMTRGILNDKNYAKTKTKPIHLYTFSSPHT